MGNQDSLDSASELNLPREEGEEEEETEVTPGWGMVEPSPGCGRSEKAGSPLWPLPAILGPAGLTPKDVSAGLPRPVASAGTWP